MDELFEQRVKLHIDCFNDDRDWTERYLKQNADENRSVTLLDDGGNLAAALYLEPMELAVKNSRIPFRFINCLGTRPDLRLRGFATRLLKKTFETFSNSPLFILLPFNVEFYLKQGFVPLNFAQWTPILGNSEFDLRNYTVADYELCASVYQTFAKQFDAYAERSDSFLKWKFIDETSIDDDSIKVILKDGKAVGYACFSDERRIGEYALLPPYDVSEVSALRGYKYAKIGTGTPFMLARVGDAEKLLRLIPYSENFCGTLKFNLSDDLIPQNNGGYTLTINNGKITNITKFFYRLDNEITITAEQLTSLATGCFDTDDHAVPDTIKSAFEIRNTLLFDIF